MTNIIPISRRIDADDAVDRQTTAVHSTLASAARDLSQVACTFEQKAVSSVIAAVGELEYGAAKLRRAAQLVKHDPLRTLLDDEILKIERLVDDARRILPGF